jgi:hypothetical protein
LKDKLNTAVWLTLELLSNNAIKALKDIVSSHWFLFSYRNATLELISVHLIFSTVACLGLGHAATV